MFGRIKKFKSINNLLLFWFLIVSIVPMIIMTGLTYDQRIKSIRQEAFNKLSGIRDIEKNGINIWFDHVSQYISFVSEEIGKRYSASRNGETAYISYSGNIKKFLSDTASMQGYLEDLYLTGPNGFLLSSSSQIDSLPNELAALQDEAISERDDVFSDVYRSNKGKLVIALVHPLLSPTGKPYGALTGTIDLETIFAELLRRPGLGNSGETMIVGTDGTVLNQLLWSDYAPLVLKANMLSAGNAQKGQNGNLREKDYRGEEVLSSYTFLPKPRWGLIVKQDLVEVDTPLFSMLHLVLIIFSFSVSGTCALAIFISRSISEPIGKITDVAKRIDKGELTARNAVDRADELGILGKNINTMADSLLSLIRIQDGITGIVSTAVTQEGTTSFAEMLIRKLVQVTGSNLGVFYIRSQEGETFMNTASIGMDLSLRGKTISADELEHQLGKSYMQKNVSFIRDIPENSIFRLKTAGGMVPPQEMISIPILTDRKIRAIIVLANLWHYQQEYKNMINLSWSSISTSFSNIVNHEKTDLMARELSHKNTELRIQSEKLRMQSRELRSQSEELLEQNIELEYQRKQVEEADRLKSEFLSNMSHELRTPLNSILALSRIMKTRGTEKHSSDEAKYLEIIERNGRQLLNLINDILDLSKIESGKIEVAPEIFSVRTCIENICESMIPLVAEKDVKLCLNLDDSLPDIESDEEKVAKILFNIIGNAVKFTNKGSVTVNAFADGPNLIIEISDTGVGIPARELPFIFDEFRQADGTSSRQFEGTGLGLAISKKTVAMLGGSIAVESEESVGSKFTVSIPLSWSGQGKVANRLRLSPGKHWKEHSIGNGRKILIVDDDFKSRSIISEYLIKEGYETVHADSGEKALKMAYLYQPFAITLDLIMPDMDGWEVLQHLKEDARTKNIPVVIISVSDEKDTGIALGAAEFMTKPVDESALIEIIGDLGKSPCSQIIIVDPDRREGKVLAEVLGKNGFKPLLLTSGKEVREKLEQARPDAIVLDLTMADKDTIAAMERFEEDHGKREMPVIIVTPKPIQASEAKEMGGYIKTGFIAKGNDSPFATGNRIADMIRVMGNGTQAAYSAPFSTRKNILVVEDNEIAALQVRMALEKEGYIIDTVIGGREALSFIEEHVPDGVILDLMMPGIDGFKVLHEIRRNPATRGVPVLVLTAKDLQSADFERLSIDHVQQLVHKGDLDKDGLVQMARTVFDGFSGRQIPLPAKKADPLMVTSRTDKARASRTLILIVEDNPDNLFSLKVLLGPDNFDFLEATNGEEGLETALDRNPDLILLDISLPKMDGYEVARRIKDNRPTRNTPIIAVTARAMMGERERALAAGCDDYISKPVDRDLLTRKVAFWIDNALPYAGEENR